MISKKQVYHILDTVPGARILPSGELFVPNRADRRRIVRGSRKPTKIAKRRGMLNLNLNTAQIEYLQRPDFQHCKEAMQSHG